MIQIIHLGLSPYAIVWDKMKQFTIERHPETPDELWLLEHPPVFTQGQAGKAEHIIHPTEIPIVQSDRGGQITYHGPGQLVIYVLMDIRRRHMGIRTLVSQLEQMIIALLHHFNITSQTTCGAPGVYVNDKKIASIGLRVKNGCTYHGISLNVAMDLSPFSHINPCGFAKLQMTQIQDFVPDIQMDQVSNRLIQEFKSMFGDL
jgi:lipoyl(octanoyl) transferase